jgi:5-methylcytosine-specific restriction protein A
MADLPNPYSVTPRRPLTDRQRLEMFLAHGGKCCICHGQIHVGEKWLDEHELALCFDGTNDLSNRGPAHVVCAKPKTAKEATDRAKVRRVAEKHFGASRPKGFRKPKGAKFDWSQGRYVVRRDDE